MPKKLFSIFKHYCDWGYLTANFIKEYSVETLTD